MRILLLGFQYQLTTGLNMTPPPPPQNLIKFGNVQSVIRHELACHYLQACLFTV